MSEQYFFEKKTVVVTGGAQGIGMATAQAFARERAHVVLADIDAEAGLDLQRTLTDQGLSVEFLKTDVSCLDDVIGLSEKTAAHREIHVLINNAGRGCHKNLFDQRIEDWESVVGTNLKGAWLCAKHISPLMPEGSAIINIASTRALMSEANTEPYSASKGGILALTHSLAMTLSPRRIRVNAISPGWIDVTSFRPEYKRKSIHLSEMDHLQHPVGRVGKPEDIAQACLFLADSNKSGFITGQNLVIDGGMTVKMIYVE